MSLDLGQQTSNPVTVAMQIAAEQSTDSVEIAVPWVQLHHYPGLLDELFCSRF